MAEVLVDVTPSADKVVWCKVPPCSAFEPFYCYFGTASKVETAAMWVYGPILRKPDGTPGDNGDRDKIIIMTGDHVGIDGIGFMPASEMESNVIGFLRMMEDDEAITFHGGGERHQERRR